MQILTEGLAAGLLGLGSYALYATFTPASSFWGKVIWRAGEITAARVSLTFDDGPTAGCTDRILDILGEHGVRGTFFVIGRNVARWPDLVRRMDAEGHLVSNHSFDHGHFDMFRGGIFWQRQLAQTNELIEQLIGKRPALFRPPMGFTTPFIHYAVRRQRQSVVTWSHRGRDGRRASAADILRRTLRGVGPGSILMLHDGLDPQLPDADPRDRAGTIEALPEMLRSVRQRGLEFICLDDLLGLPGYADAPSVAPAANVARAIQ